MKSNERECSFLSFSLSDKYLFDQVVNHPWFLFYDPWYFCSIHRFSRLMTTMTTTEKQIDDKKKKLWQSKRQFSSKGFCLCKCEILELNNIDKRMLCFVKVDNNHKISSFFFWKKESSLLNDENVIEILIKTRSSTNNCYLGSDPSAKPFAIFVQYPVQKKTIVRPKKIFFPISILFFKPIVLWQF